MKQIKVNVTCKMLNLNVRFEPITLNTTQALQSFKYMNLNNVTKNIPPFFSFTYKNFYYLYVI